MLVVECVPKLAQPLYAALCLGAIQKMASVTALLFFCLCLFEHALSSNLRTFSAERGPVSRGTRLATYPSLCQNTTARHSWGDSRVRPFIGIHGIKLSVVLPW